MVFDVLELRFIQAHRSANRNDCIDVHFTEKGFHFIVCDSGHGNAPGYTRCCKEVEAIKQNDPL